jgi:hypothetical protein
MGFKIYHLKTECEFNLDKRVSKENVCLLFDKYSNSSTADPI